MSQVRRSQFLIAAAGLAALSLPALAQQEKRVRRIAIYRVGPDNGERSNQSDEPIGSSHPGFPTRATVVIEGVMTSELPEAWRRRVIAKGSVGRD